MKRDDDIWFEPKRHGYGAGLPVAWPGWALLGGWLAALVAIGVVLPPSRHPIAYGIAVAAISAAFVVTVARHTRGGFRWRSGGEDSR